VDRNDDKHYLGCYVVSEFEGDFWAEHPPAAQSAAD